MVLYGIVLSYEIGRKKTFLRLCAEIRKKRKIHSASEYSLTFRFVPVILNIRSEIVMKQHKFWAWCAVISMIMVMYTGYKHK